MRYLYIIIFLLLAAFHFNAQGQIINNDYAIDKHNMSQTKHVRKRAKETAEEATNIAAIAAHDAAVQKKAIAAQSGNKSATDSYTAAKDHAQVTAKAASAATKAAASDWKGFIFGTGTVTDLENIKSPNGNLSIGGLLNYRFNTIMFAFNPNPVTTPDSSNIKKTFLFPEISSQAFVMEYDRSLIRICKKNTDSIKFTTNFFVNFSYSTTKEDTNKINPYNLSTGFRLSYHINLSNSNKPNAKKINSFIQKINKSIKDANNVSISLTPYYSMINIDSKDYASYGTIFNKNNGGSLQPTINGVGGKFTIQIGNLQVFVDGKYIVNNNSSSIFNSSYYTIGSAINTKIFNFL